MGQVCWREYVTKRFDRASTDELNARLAAGWDAMRARVSKVTVGARQIAQVLEDAGAPAEAVELGCPPALFDAALAHAREIRDRYTFLDLVADRIA
jgi:glycerol-1-phosphate dehydrogenase [NAD(P)+]